MRHDEPRKAALARAKSHEAWRIHARRCARIEIAGWLVREQQSWRVGNRPRYGDPLLFAAGELAWSMRGAPHKTQIIQHFLPSAPPSLSFPSPLMVVCGDATISNAVNSGSKWWNW